MPAWPPPLADALEVARRIAADDSSSDADRRRAEAGLLDVFDSMLDAPIERDFVDTAQTDHQLRIVVGSAATPPAVKAAAFRQLAPESAPIGSIAPQIADPANAGPLSPAVVTIDPSSHRQPSNPPHPADAAAPRASATPAEAAATQPLPSTAISATNPTAQQ